MRREAAMWAGLLTGPIVWFISLEAKLVLSPWVCAFHWKPAVYVVSLAALVITMAAGLVSWREWSSLRSSGEQTFGRPQAMAVGGMFLSAGFVVVLLAQSLPELILAGCE